MLDFLLAFSSCLNFQMIRLLARSLACVVNFIYIFRFFCCLRNYYFSLLFFVVCILIIIFFLPCLVSIFIIFTVSWYILPEREQRLQSNQTNRIQSISIYAHYRYCKLCIVLNNRASFLRKAKMNKKKRIERKKTHSHTHTNTW